MKKWILFSVVAVLCLFFGRVWGQGLAGRVVDERGLGLPGATVRLGAAAGVTDSAGRFVLPGLGSVSGEMVVSFVGYEGYRGKFVDMVVLRPVAGTLSEVQVVGYGSVSRRLNTGSVGSVGAAELRAQPVTNVLSALSGRVQGLFVQTTNGLPGGNVSLQIRGKGSLQAGTDPLYVIDGVPFASSVVPAGNIVIAASVTGPVSPLNSLNPADIESVSVLKDADATAIYGSRGANGVVPITTRRGKAGAARFEVSLAQGVSRVGTAPGLLGNADYLALRREAFRNDGLLPTATTAPDLVVWDTTRSTDWNRYFFGGTGRSTELQAGLSGGSGGTLYNLSGNYHRETAVLPGDNRYGRGGLHWSLQQAGPGQRWSLLFSGAYTADANRLTNVVNNASTAVILPPDYPIYDAAGAYNWNIFNPEAVQEATSKIATENLLANMVAAYRLLPGLELKLSGGYNQLVMDQAEIFPSVALFPGTANYTNFGRNAVRSVILEPQLNFRRDWGRGTLSVLAGATYQARNAPGETSQGTNFTSRSLMENIGSAGTVVAANSYTAYRYVSLFGRLTYNWQDTYVLNLTARRDGSSRFGPEHRFGNFGSLGGAWLFGRLVPFLSSGKLRASYGLTGNDQIPDYQYLSTYGSSASYNYQAFAALVPTRIANADFHWETTRKLDVALELGWWKDRLLLSVDRYRNRSDDQLVAYAIPYLTGFNTYQANLPAVVENTGWELSLNAQYVRGKRLNWSGSFNLTLPHNDLVSFQDFATSSYAQTLQLGYDITRVTGYQLLGVDPATGLAAYAKQGSSPYLYNTLGKQTPDFYGGWGNSLAYGNWQLDVFASFAKQMAKGGLFTSPGLKYNSYALVLDRWQHPGDVTGIPKASTVNDPYFTSSSANFFNASYFRLKNVALTYRLPRGWRVYAQAQNLFTLWDRRAPLLDPESGALTATAKNIPPFRTILAGFQINL